MVRRLVGVDSERHILGLCRFWERITGQVEMIVYKQDKKGSEKWSRQKKQKERGSTNSRGEVAVQREMQKL